MGLFDILKKQFVDTIEWVENEPGVLAYRFPMQDQEIQNGAKLTVRETQQALFVNEGKIADFFEAGLYTLNTQTLPVMTSLQNWDKLFQSPFKSDVFFFSNREQIDQRWGTPNPIVIRDKEFGPLQLRAHGSYSYKIIDPKVFFQKISGTCDVYRVENMEGQLRAAIITALASFFAKAPVGFIDMAASQVTFSNTLQEYLQSSFNAYGLSLESFFVLSITLPQNLQEHLDKVASMNIVGDLKKYAQFQAADSISLAAENPGGGAGLGTGLGVGLMMGQTIQNNTNPPAPPVSEDPFVLLEKFHGLLTKGIISQEEFDKKKNELLQKI